ncbi:prepilin peptidase [Sphingomonas sp.]|uniref:A24 family peptidase n=1 Tax=Sphingomonas sp. TaxID=28214 RepID=UPI001D3C992F|nr:prepilin peptidase [Sphingomonas sp.]MBX9797593.1 prepilin peptidase [Sphingomonas sp.]
MGTAYFTIALLAALMLLLLSCGIEDARQRTIANWKNAAIALLAPCWWWANGLALWPDMAFQLGVALFVFALFVGAFALGQMGGGDVKLIGALALWLPLQPLTWMLIVMSIAGGVLTIVMLADHKWRRATGPMETPYGVAIAIAGFVSLREPLFNPFT